MAANQPVLKIKKACGGYSYSILRTNKKTEKTNRYAAIMGLTPQSVFVKDYKARWGSCFPDGKISYNWRIIIAPHHIVDYVVVHELCHLKHPNHSPAYWRSVKRVVPEFAIFRKWLSEHGSKLVI